MIRRVIACLTIFTVTCYAQQVMPAMGSTWKGTAAVVPTLLNSTYGTSGVASVTTSFSPTNGHSLVVFAINDGVGAALTCSDGEGTGNTYTRDSDKTATTVQRGGWFHANNISGSGTYTITCTGSGADFFLYVGECAKSSISLATTSVGTNVDVANGGSNSPIGAGFTTSTANVLMLDAFADTTGSSGTITSTDVTFTLITGGCSNGGSCYVGEVASKLISVTGAQTGGFTNVGGSFNQWNYAMVGYQ